MKIKIKTLIGHYNTLQHHSRENFFLLGKRATLIDGIALDGEHKPLRKEKNKANRKPKHNHIAD